MLAISFSIIGALSALWLALAGQHKIVQWGGWFLVILNTGLLLFNLFRLL